MRYSEFNPPQATKNTGYYTVGDSIAYNLGSANDIWVSLATPGSTSSSSMHTHVIDMIPKGSVVAISVGGDDSPNLSVQPEQIADSAANIVNYAKSKKLNPVFVIFPSTLNKNIERNNEIREAIKSKVPVRMLDMNGPGGVPANYTGISSQIIEALKPTADFVPDKSISKSIAKGTSAKRKSTINLSGMGEEISNYLATKMDDNHRLGLLANIKQESNFNPAAFNSRERSGGLFQHHDNFKRGEYRFSNMVKATGGGNAWKTNWQGQIDYALSEPEGRKYLAKDFRTPAEAVEWWVRYFERPKETEKEVALRTSFLKNLA